MSAHDPQGYELAAFNYFKELQPDCQDSHLPMFLDNFTAIFISINQSFYYFFTIIWFISVNMTSRRKNR